MQPWAAQLVAGASELAPCCSNRLGRFAWAAPRPSLAPARWAGSAASFAPIRETCLIAWAPRRYFLRTAGNLPQAVEVATPSALVAVLAPGLAYTPLTQPQQ